jgi:hypothetical protein
MEVNVITPFFSIIFNSKFKQHKEEVNDTNSKDSTLEIMKKCLNV